MGVSKRKWILYQTSGIFSGNRFPPKIQLVSFRYRKRCGSSLEIPSRSLRCSS